MDGKVFAPWTAEQVKNLNAYQRASWGHPYTCRADSRHSGPGGSFLHATEYGWVCAECDYTQDWAWDYTTEPPPDQFVKLWDKLMGINILDEYK